MDDKMRNESGQSMILIALLIVALLAIAGLVLDGGRVYAARRASQNSSDGAALAGVRALTVGKTDGDIRAAVDKYAMTNGAASAGDITAYYLDNTGAKIGISQVGSNGSVPSGATGVTVTVNFKLDPLLMGVINNGSTVDVLTLAGAQSGRLSQTDIMPMTVQVPPGCDVNGTTQCFPYDTPVQLFGQVQGGGAFQWLGFAGANNPGDIAAYLMMTKQPPSYSVPGWIPNGPGNMVANEIKQALNWWLTKPEDQRHWTIPVYDYTNGLSGNNLQYHIVRFAEFVFLSYDFTGSNKYIMGKFIRWIVPDPGNPGSCNSNGLDICAMWLVQ